MLGCYSYMYPYLNMMPMMTCMSQDIGKPQCYNQLTNNIQFTNRFMAQMFLIWGKYSEFWKKQEFRRKFFVQPAGFITSQVEF